MVGPGVHLQLGDLPPGEAVSRPVTWGELFATLYHNLGIDSHRATLTDLTGRPQYLAEEDAGAMAELV